MMIQFLIVNVFIALVMRKIFVMWWNGSSCSNHKGHACDTGRKRHVGSKAGPGAQKERVGFFPTTTCRSVNPKHCSWKWWCGVSFARTSKWQVVWDKYRKRHRIFDFELLGWAWQPSLIWSIISNWLEGTAWTTMGWINGNFYQE